MHKMIVPDLEELSELQLRMRLKATDLLSSRRFLTLPTALQNALVPPAMTVLGAMNIGCEVTGSGVLEERSFSPHPFSRIHIADGFEARIIPGDSHGVRVVADDNLMAYVKMSSHNGELRLDLDNIHHRRSSLFATIALPCLEAVELVSSRASIQQMGDTEQLRLSAFAGSDLQLRSAGHLRHLTVSNSGGSQCRVNAQVSEALFELTGGGTTAAQGRARTAEIYLDGGSTLEASGLLVAELALRMSAGARAFCHASRTAGGRLTGGSQLKLKGGAHLDIESSGQSLLTQAA